MKKRKESELTFQQSMALNWRAFRLLYQRCPAIFWLQGIKAALTALSPYATVFLSARLITELSTTRDPHALTVLAVLTVAVTALCTLLKAIFSRWADSQVEAYYLCKEIYGEKLMGLDFCDMDNQHTHDLLSQIQQVSRWSGWGLPKIAYTFPQAMTALFRILGAGALCVTLFTSRVPQDSPLVWMNHPLWGSIVVLVILMAVVLLSARVSRKAESCWEHFGELATQGNRIFGFFSHKLCQLDRALDMRIYRQENIAGDYLATDNAFGVTGPFSQAAKGRMGLLFGLSSAMTQLITLISYGFVCLKAWAGAFSVGAVTQYISALTGFATGMTDLLENIGTLQVNGVYLRTTFEFLDIPNGMYQGSLTTEKRSDRQYEVEFRNVSFRYPGTEQDVLHNVSLKFRVGSRLAVVGMNGSGKTTFIKLLCRLYDPTEGEILLNGINIRKYRYDDYQAIFSVVFQDHQLLSLPLGQNVAAAMDYNPEKAEASLNDAGFQERLQQLPKWLDTCLNRDFEKDGVLFSGGEKQKIAIARSLYKDAPFIILDEPTAALDPVAEADIYTKFDAIVGDKTAIYISHRLSSCRFCDEIAVFDNGRIVQFGTHDELLRDEQGKYFELWHAQAQYYTV